MTFLKAPFTNLCRLPIWIYRVTLGWMLPPRCRFYPSCSRYADDALRRHGVWPGLKLIVGRLLRCHPWHPGGVDPVPDHFKNGAKNIGKAR